MHFSLFLNPQTHGPDDDPRVIESMTEEALAADAAGFASVALTEHHFNDYNTYSDPFIYGGYLAPQLKNAWLTFAVAAAPYRNPIRLAEYTNLLDILMRGRLIIGLGASSSPPEAAGFGRVIEQRYELFDQVVDIMQRAWTHTPQDPPLEYETPFDVGKLYGRIMPASYRRPHPMLARACQTERSIVDAARRGWPALLGRLTPDETRYQLDLYSREMRDAGYAEDVVQRGLFWTSIQKMIHVAETDELAWAEIEDPLTEYARAAMRIRPTAALGVTADGQAVAHPHTTWGGREYYAEKVLICGSPDTVARRLQEFGDAGLQGMLVYMSWGFNPPDIVQRSMRLFRDEVMPRLDTRWRDQLAELDGVQEANPKPVTARLAGT